MSRLVLPEEIRRRLRAARLALSILAEGALHKSYDLFPRGNKRDPEFWQKRFFDQARTAGIVATVGIKGQLRYHALDLATAFALSAEQDRQLLWMVCSPTEEAILTGNPEKMAHTQAAHPPPPSAPLPEATPPKPPGPTLEDLLLQIVDRAVEARDAARRAEEMLSRSTPEESPRGPSEFDERLEDRLASIMETMHSMRARLVEVEKILREPTEVDAAAMAPRFDAIEKLVKQNEQKLAERINRLSKNTDAAFGTLNRNIGRVPDVVADAILDMAIERGRQQPGPNYLMPEYLPKEAEK